MGEGVGDINDIARQGGEDPDGRDSFTIAADRAQAAAVGADAAPWLALAIGNSRLHWGWFVGAQRVQVWHTPHAQALQAQAWLRAHPLPLAIASVVPGQTEFWQGFPQVQLFSLNQVPLGQCYATLGLDRAIALYGATQRYGTPALVIDCGTAWTLTGCDAARNLVGGAILPGLRLQFEALGRSTALLPRVKADWSNDPLHRWALETEGAIASGVWYSLCAGVVSFVGDWRRRFPDSAVVITGGDGDRLYPVMLRAIAQNQESGGKAMDLGAIEPGVVDRDPLANLVYEPDLLLLGMADLRQVLTQ